MTETDSCPNGLAESSMGSGPQVCWYCQKPRKIASPKEVVTLHNREGDTQTLPIACCASCGVMHELRHVLPMACGASVLIALVSGFVGITAALADDNFREYSKLVLPSGIAFCCSVAVFVLAILGYQSINRRVRKLDDFEEYGMLQDLLQQGWKLPESLSERFHKEFLRACNEGFGDSCDFSVRLGVPMDNIVRGIFENEPLVRQIGRTVALRLKAHGYEIEEFHFEFKSLFEESRDKLLGDPSALWTGQQDPIDEEQATRESETHAVTNVIVSVGDGSVDVRETTPTPQDRTRCPKCGHEFARTTANEIASPEPCTREDEDERDRLIFANMVAERIESSGGSMPHLQCPKCGSTYMAGSPQADDDSH